MVENEDAELGSEPNTTGGASNPETPNSATGAKAITNYLPPEARTPENTGHAVKRKTLAIIIRDRAVLYAAYMPFLKSGGLFIPTKKPFVMGEECILSISLLDDTTKYVTRAKVVWITPPGSQGNKAGGVGAEFAEDAHGTKLRTRIEEVLGASLQSSNATHTM
jgi:type IV pilus assembly protein PilZ